MHVYIIKYTEIQIKFERIESVKCEQSFKNKVLIKSSKSAIIADILIKN